MRDFFETTNKNFDSVFSSTALRAVETIEIIKPAIKDTEIVYKKDLYTCLLYTSDAADEE